MKLLTDEERKLANGNVPFKKVYPNGSEEIYFCGHVINVKAPSPSGKMWSKSLSPSICINRKYGEHDNAVKRGGRWYFISYTENGIIWK